MKPYPAPSIHCAAAYCSNRQSKLPNLAFFRFPRNRDRCHKWLKHASREDLVGKSLLYLNKNCHLCAEHFEKDQFSYYTSKCRLKWNAVPTIFKASYITSDTDYHRASRGKGTNLTEENSHEDPAPEERIPEESESNTTVPQRSVEPQRSESTSPLEDHSYCKADGHDGHDCHVDPYSFPEQESVSSVRGVSFVDEVSQTPYDDMTRVDGEAESDQETEILSQHLDNDDPMSDQDDNSSILPEADLTTGAADLTTEADLATDLTDLATEAADPQLSTDEAQDMPELEPEPMALERFQEGGDDKEKLKYQLALNFGPQYVTMLLKFFRENPDSSCPEIIPIDINSLDSLPLPPPSPPSDTASPSVTQVESGAVDDDSELPTGSLILVDTDEPEDSKLPLQSVMEDCVITEYIMAAAAASSSSSSSNVNHSSSPESVARNESEAAPGVTPRTVSRPTSMRDTHPSECTTNNHHSECANSNHLQQQQQQHHQLSKPASSFTAPVDFPVMLDDDRHVTISRNCLKTLITLVSCPICQAEVNHAETIQGFKGGTLFCLNLFCFNGHNIQPRR
ncbi:hypothetical protein Ahia01_001072500 [Argonauta hians]